MHGALSRALGGALVFVAALALGLALHLNLAPVRRSVALRVTAALEPVFAGKLTIERIGGLGLTHVDDVDARVEDPDGTRVIRATGVSAHVSTGALLRSLRGGDIVVAASDVSVAGGDVNLDTDGAGTPLIVKALTPRAPSVPGGPPGRGVRLTLSRVHLTHASVRGTLDGVPPIDGEVDGADARLLVSPDKIAVDVDRAQVVLRALPGGQDARGTSEAHLTLPSPTGHALGLRVVVRGALGPLAGLADFALDGGAIDALVDAPAVSTRDARSLWPAWPLVVPAGLHAEAHGSLPRLMVRARASAGAATLEAAGPFTVAPRLQAALHVNASGFDVNALTGSEPTSDLAATGDVTFAEQPNGGIDGRAVIDLPAGRVGTVLTPPIAWNVEMSRAPPPAATIKATVKAALRVPGAPTVVTARLTPKRGSFVLSFDADASAPELENVAWLRRLAQGRAVGHAEGTLDIANGTLDAQGSVAAEDLSAYGIEAQGARVEVHATGALFAPALDVQVEGEGVDAGRLSCSSLRGSGRVEIHDGVTLRDLDVAVRSTGQHARLRARVVRIDDDDVRVEDATLRGFGAPLEATVRWSPGRLYVQAKSGPMDLARVAKFTKVSVLQGGRVSLDVDASVGAGVADGRVALDVSHAAFATFKDASAHVEAMLHGRDASGRLTVSVADIGAIDVQSPSVHVGEGSLLSLSTWRRSWGAATMNTHVDLPKLVARLPPGTLPFRELKGLLDMTVRADLDASGDPSPDVDWTATTTGLEVAGGAATAPWRFEGIDPTLHLAVDGETGATALEVKLQDAAGQVLEVDARSTAVPYASLFSGEAWVDRLRAMPFDATALIPARSLDTLPAAWGLQGYRGEVNANMDWHGPAVHPAIHLVAGLLRGSKDRSASALPVDLSVSAQYDGEHASATLQGTNKNKVVLDASATAEVRAQDLLDGIGGSTIPWTASGRAKLDALPVRAIAFLDDRQVRGRASGELTLERLHDDAHASATVTIDALKVGEIACRGAIVRATVDGHTLDASARIEQEDGSVEAHVHAGARWGRALVPALDPSVAGQASLSARQFRVGLLLPFVSGFFSELDGRVDADARVAIDEATLAVRPEGTATLTEGEFELPSLGGEFTDVGAKLTLTPDGLLRIENAVAHGVSGRIEAAASARMAGLAFVGARATVQVPKKDPLPVVLDGVQVGRMDGHFDITASEAAGRQGLDVTIDVPSLHMQLPVSRTHEVQALGDLEGVTTGVLRGPNDFVDVPLDATYASPLGPPRARIKIAVKLGGDVEVTRGEDLDVHLQGEPVITIAEDVTVTGQIRLVRGTLDVYGKPFEIESGTVNFVGPDPGNPQVVLTAGWTAQDGTQVSADFVGPLKTGKVTLRSEPALPESAILALILYGTSDSDTGNVDQQVNQAASTLAGAAGGAATAPINRLLDNLGVAGGISTKIDTSQTNPRPEVEVQIARDISLQLAWVLGAPTPGTNPDTTLVTLDWRFLRKWSLETTVGDAGTSILDVIWQHRY